jgi:large subunit ribosomal protein L22
MESVARSKNNRISAQKARLVANEVRGFPLNEAVDVLKAMPKKGAVIILKTLVSAGANAKVQNQEIAEKDLFIKKIVVDEGPTMKRYRARARGRAGRIRKRTSTVTIVLSDEK